ncbi:IucA/IucC family siderophore biosynthesis protein [Streptomyces sp. AV19]|uniref:IucA/IucC family protein n=1 Tax=Streptomyces sp. AV19 TaxID=2793068 RepID=UPI0018FE2C0A|nr:IucA/IucC family protein [Streptomyces sp. AV19]MBH1934394.1 IucA/IucC family siderophore biosynthesis protein [Streptomyces sp. AV19]MDG4536245.1 IucA/IucC family siderophore biosynthesis protein [Streptomyces sp. AV19]
MNAFARTSEALAVAPLLNCLLREAADPAGEPAAGRAVHQLRACGRLLRVRTGHRPSAPELWTGGTWQPLCHADLVDLAAHEMRAATGRPNTALTAEMTAGRTALEALLAARARTAPPDDPWLRSEQALVMGHPYHPAPKARSGGGPPDTWLRYAPEAHARFPLVLLGVREDAAADDGDTRALDALGQAPPGHRLLPVHPWQFGLTHRLPAVRAAFADGRLVRLGVTPWEARATSSVRTVHIRRTPERPDLFLKFSLEVQITNDVRRIRRHELRDVRRTDPLVVAAFRAMDGPAAWLGERGHRTVRGLEETFPVIVREGLDGHLLPGTTAVLAAALPEGFDGNPLDRLADPLPWWSAYLRSVVPPVLEAYARHGVAVECHLQNTLVAVDADGTPVQAVFRDTEGAKAIPDTPREIARQRLVYCLVVNNLIEIASVLAHRFPRSADALWPVARREFERYDKERGFPGAEALLTAPTVPAKANLLSRWIDADGTEPRYLPVPNPLVLTNPAASAS